ncbi:cell division control protein [Plectosphaerella plurivora]|uniref:Cell division control protein n=1 Tax=Plectosphaerella plurivora TaxID=936078 RepID=A0A9P8UUY5_9PEZI|nr:cell division control protein [Plectosphaerella plurivora]
MPAASAEPPGVSLSFANNFWGKDDAGVVPLLGRMQASKQTCDELKAFYNARASLEDEYSRRLLALCRKPLGSQETGSLRTSFDTLRGEVESMGRQHQNIAAQMKTELEEPLAAFSGGMKERRKIVQNGIEKLHKVKVQQTQQVNKTRDRYEQECLKIKGYLAQGHMVMGQEERKNKAKLEKTQISVATSNTEYENAVKALEDTTTRWNREWKAAADKFQDLEEERLDFTKSSLWQFANIASTVCVSDDASCEKVRLSLEKVDVETDIIAFIKERGTGQEIPDAPKYINFCRGDMTDTQSEASEDDSYSVAQFPRSINPAFRSSSPQPSTYESHHDPNSTLAHDMGHRDHETTGSREASMTPRGMFPPSTDRRPGPSDVENFQQQPRPMLDMHNRGPVSAVPHDPYPLDGMTMLCRTGPPSERSSQPASARPGSRDSHSDYSNPTSMSSVEPLSGKTSPIKQDVSREAVSDKRVLKKRSGFFQNHSPFRRKSTKEVQPATTGRNTWHSAPTGPQGSPARRQQLFVKNTQNTSGDEYAGSPEPIEANASLALNVGQNVFNVTTPDLDRRSPGTVPPRVDESDPIALALAELRGVSPDKQATARVSADRYLGIATPAPASQQQFSKSVPPSSNGGSSVAAGLRGTPPPSYDQPVQRLGVPQPAVTARAMKETSQKFADQARTMFGSTTRLGSDSSAYGGQVLPRTSTRGADVPRAVSPATPRSKSPRPDMGDDGRVHYSHPSSPSPGPSRVAPAQNRSSDQNQYRHSSPNNMSRSASPAHFRQYARSNSGHGQPDMAMQLAPATDDVHGSQRGRGGGGRPGTSSSNRAMGLYEGGAPVQSGSRQRSKSVADPSRQYTSDGRPILHFARALYVYQAAIPEELGFSKGEILAVLRHQDDGWWEAEVQGGSGQVGLVPSNYLQPC